jgi:hypothetical protein
MLERRHGSLLSVAHCRPTISLLYSTVTVFFVHCGYRFTGQPLSQVLEVFPREFGMILSGFAARLCS